MGYRHWVSVWVVDGLVQAPFPDSDGVLLVEGTLTCNLGRGVVEVMNDGA